jgi:hypothetical protein
VSRRRCLLIRKRTTVEEATGLRVAVRSAGRMVSGLIFEAILLEGSHLSASLEVRLRFCLDSPADERGQQ